MTASTTVCALSDGERAAMYHLLSCLLASQPDDVMLARVCAVRGDTSVLGEALSRLAKVARDSERDALADQYQRLFIGIGQGEIVPYGSHYLAGSLHDLPLVALRGDMRRLGVRGKRGVAEPEDHAATVLEIMAGLISERFGNGKDAEKRFFEEHAASWLPRFFADLAAVADAPFYAAVGATGAVFLRDEGARYDGTVDHEQ